MKKLFSIIALVAWFIVELLEILRPIAVAA